MTYLKKWFNLKKTPQSAPIPGTSQVRNSNAGYSWGGARVQSGCGDE